MNRARIPLKEYERLATQFNRAKFTADDRAQLAVDAGRGHVVHDCKHHAGFAMYHFKVSKCNVYDATPWHRDPFKEREEACARRGLWLCFYYSQAPDWYEPDGAGNDWDFAPDPLKDFDRYLREKSLLQVCELPGVKGTITKAYLLVDCQPLLFTQTEEAVRVRLPDTAGALLDTVRCLELRDIPDAQQERN
jgi:hypothetical protein